MVVDSLSEHEIDRIFQALSDTTRRDIFVRTIGDGCSISVLARSYDMSFAAVQKHVTVLERAALVTKTRRGREKLVRGNVPTLLKATALLDGFEQVWRQRAQRIAEVLDEEGGPS